MQPKLVAISYMLNRNGYDAKFAQCHNIGQQHFAAYQREDQKCAKEEIVKTPILTIFERAQHKRLQGGAEGLGGGYGSELRSGVQGLVLRNGHQDNLQGYSDPVCPKEQGYCVTSSGRDQNSGVRKLNGWKVWDDELNIESGGTLKGQRE